jgi:hypothetical protein
MEEAWESVVGGEEPEEPPIFVPSEPTPLYPEPDYLYGSADAGYGEYGAGTEYTEGDSGSWY